MSFFDDASLAFLPSGGAGKDTKAYSIKPTDGSGDFTFSRGSNLAATRVGPTGLIEKGRENLLLQSNQFDTIWGNGNTTETGGQIGYDGSSDAWLLEKNPTAFSYINQNISVSGVFTFSVYAKANTLSEINLRISTGTRAVFDLSNGTTISPLAKITDVGNGWYRCEAAFIDTITSARIYPDWSESDAGSIYIQDAQLEIGLAATEVITTGATTGKAGLLEDEPRFDYSGGATCPSLLLEPSRTNIVKQSEYFNATDHILNTNISVTNNATISPEGLTNAAEITFDSNTARGLASLTFGDYSNQTHSVSIYAKSSGGVQNVRLKLTAGGVADYFSSNFQLTDEWQRFEFSQAFGATTTSNIQGGIVNGTGETTGTAYIYGLQLEANASYPTSYIPNHSGGSVTRGYDYSNLLNIDTNIVDITGDFTFFVDNTGSLIKGTEVFHYFIVLFWDAVTNIRYYSTSNGSWYYRPDNAYAGHTNSVGKQIIKYENGVFYHFLNGNKSASTLTMATTNSLSQIQFFANTGGRAGYLDIKQALLFDTALSDADCITLTTL